MPNKGRRIFCLAFLPAVAFLTPAQLAAQTSSNITLPGSSGQTCVQVKVPGENASPYNCLNQELQQQVEGAAPPPAQLPLDASSPSNTVGTFNEQSVSEQYGKNFGKSVIPYRPPALVFSNAVGATP